MSGNTMVLGGLFTWFLGYVSNTLMPIVPGIKSVRLPNWAMLFLGKSRTKPYRSGVAFLNLSYQLFGLFAVVWGIIINIFGLEPALFTIIGIFSGIIFGYLSSLWLYRKSPYIWYQE